MSDELKISEEFLSYVNQMCQVVELMDDAHKNFIKQKTIITDTENHYAGKANEKLAAAADAIENRLKTIKENYSVAWAMMIEYYDTIKQADEDMAKQFGKK